MLHPSVCLIYYNLSQALYTLMDNDHVDPLTLNFPVNRVYVALGINQPAVGRCAFRYGKSLTIIVEAGPAFTWLTLLLYVAIMTMQQPDGLCDRSI